MAAPPKPKDSFRVPNSVIQGMTTTTMSDLETATGLNRLTPFEMVTLLGLLTRVSPKRPHEEVRSTVSEIMAIVEVSRRVAHAVERKWDTADGQQKCKRYKARRHSPKHLRKIHEALLSLHGKTVVVRRAARSEKREVTDRLVHLLDSFGYVYELGGKELDLHALPPGADKVNVGTADRPVWRVRQVTEDGGRFERPTGIVFRLNAELATELQGEQGTIGYTLMARKVFKLLKQFMRNPGAIRLVLLIVRQTDAAFTRRLAQTFDDLGFDGTHPRRAHKQLNDLLDGLVAARLVDGFDVNPDTDRLAIRMNRNWYQEGETAGTV